MGTFAGGSYSGRIQPYFYGGFLYLIPVTSTKLNLPACATRHFLKLSVDLDDPRFGPQYSMILAAWMAEKELSVTGRGTCTGEGDEIIKSILIKE